MAELLPSVTAPPDGLPPRLCVPPLADAPPAVTVPPDVEEMRVWLPFLVEPPPLALRVVAAPPKTKAPPKPSKVLAVLDELEVEPDIPSVSAAGDPLLPQAASRNGTAPSTLRVLLVLSIATTAPGAAPVHVLHPESHEDTLAVQEGEVTGNEANFERGRRFRPPVLTGLRTDSRSDPRSESRKCVAAVTAGSSTRDPSTSGYPPYANERLQPSARSNGHGARADELYRLRRRHQRVDR